MFLTNFDTTFYSTTADVDGVAAATTLAKRLKADGMRFNVLVTFNRGKPTMYEKNHDGSMSESWKTLDELRKSWTVPVDFDFDVEASAVPYESTPPWVKDRKRLRPCLLYT